MRNILLLSSFLLSISFAHAQRLTIEAPNYSYIKSEIKNQNSPYYYPKLFQRYLANDTTLNINEYRALYYGFTYQKAYLPYGNPPQDAILARYANKDQLSIADCDTILLNAGQLVAKFPFDIHWINRMAYAYHVKGDDLDARLLSYKAKMIIQTIFSTGNGRMVPTAWHVIEVGDEYEIIYMLGLFPLHQTLVGLECDHITVETNRSGVNGFYFNVKRLLDMEGAQ
jgi:hypothetical protein